jgi:DNA-binding SARP family transcriptional activator/predicted ATPase
VDRPKNARGQENVVILRDLWYTDANVGGRVVAHLALSLLGPFEATLDGQAAEGLNSDHLRALLAYLAVERKREHSRAALASLLWPERPDPEALSALRHALANLRAALGDRQAPNPFVLVTRNGVQFNQASDHWLDVADFLDLTGLQDLSGLTRAVQLYRGPFLHGLSVADSPALDDWLLLMEEEYRHRVLSVLEYLTSLEAAHGDYAAAARWARRQLELEPYREAAHRQLMAALALGGERPAALAHYETCRRVLDQELGCEPDDETQALYARIRDGTLPLPVATVTTSNPELEVTTPSCGAPCTHAAVSCGRALGRAVPASPPPFVAREEELARLGSLLEQALAGHGGLALISGEAGSGKTALLDEFAGRASRAHGDLIALRGQCNAHAGAGDPYLPFREMLQILAGDVEGRRAGGTLSSEQARRVWEALPAVGAALVEHGPDLIDTFVPGEALLRRAEAFPGPAGTGRWQARLREIVGRSPESTAPASRTIPSAPPLQANLFGQVTQVLRTLSTRQALLLAVDDLQWADGGTAALLFHLGRRLPGSRILLACAFRPEALQDTPDPKGLGRPLGSVLRELTREWGDIRVDLDQADGRGFVEAYVDSEPNRLGADFRQALYEHTGGNPLFTVELLRNFERDGTLVQDEAGRWVPSAAAGPDWERWPPQVEAVIAGHMAGLADEDRTLLQAASVQGEQFVAEVTARVLGCDEEAAVRRLSGPLRTRDRLVGAVSLERLPLSGQRLSHYRFRHSLFQVSAYRSLDAVERARLHEATGRALQAIYAEGERPAGLAATLARHYEAAGMSLEAARALHDAGHQAMRLAAFRQALDRFDHGLALLAAEPHSPQRTEIERLLQVARLGPQRTLAGSGSARLAGALAQAAAVGAGDAQGPPRLTILSAEASLLTSTGRLEEALQAAERMLDAASQWGEESFVAHAHWRFGLIHHLMGDLREAERHFDWVLARATPERGAELRGALGYDVTAHTLAFSAMDQWLLGYPEKALARSTQAVTGALEHGDLFGQACAAAVGSMLLFLLRSELTPLQERSELCHRLCLQQGFASWQAYAQVLLGWLVVMRGDLDGDAGIERMRSAIAGWQSAGMAIGVDGLVLVLADGCLVAARRCPAPTPLRSGDYRGDDAQRASLLATALAAIDTVLGPNVLCGQSYQAELHRVRGELLLARDGLAAAGEALPCFRRALQLSREQGALAWELRAAMSLVRLRQRRHGPRGEAEREGDARAAELAEAQSWLRDLYARFAEGFAFPDLVEAKALLEELA